MVAVASARPRLWKDHNRGIVQSPTLHYPETLASRVEVTPAVHLCLHALVSRACETTENMTCGQQPGCLCRRELRRHRHQEEQAVKYVIEEPRIKNPCDKRGWLDGVHVWCRLPPVVSESTVQSTT
jgi:hypothetical protein